MSTPEPVRVLLAAIADTLDLPSPAIGLKDEVAHRILVDERISLVRLAIRDVLAGDTRGLEWEADYLRRKAEERPATYQTLAQPLEKPVGGEPR